MRGFCLHLLCTTKCKNMEEVKIATVSVPVAFLDILINLHAKQIAQTNLLIDFLSGISGKSSQELKDSIGIRATQARKDVLESLYSEYGLLPADLKNWIEGQL